MAIAFLIGSVAGVLIVRILFLDPVQVIGWDMFWNGLSNGEIMSPEVVFHSETFYKCIGGLAVGGILGVLVGNAIQKGSKGGQGERDAV